MLKVKGIPILVSEIEILNLIKERVSQEQGREILRKIKKSGDNIMVCCPNIAHNNGQERKPSCGIVTVDKMKNGKLVPAGTFNCYGCGSHGTFEQFVSLCFAVDDDGAFGEKWLLDNFVTGETYERPQVFTPVERPNILLKLKQKPTYVSEEELASYRFYHPYMWKRKLTPEIVEKYDVGYQKDYRIPYQKEDGTTVYSQPIECLTFPCRDKNGNCLFVSRRAIYGKAFYLPLNLEKPVYGIYELPKDAKAAVICESVINALTCASYGIPALALFGTGDALQMEQLKYLSIRHYVLGLDPDKAGAKGTYKLKNALRNKQLSKLIIPRGKDINDLSRDEFFSLPEVYI